MTDEGEGRLRMSSCIRAEGRRSKLTRFRQTQVSSTAPTQALRSITPASKPVALTAPMVLAVLISPSSMET